MTDSYKFVNIEKDELIELVNVRKNMHENGVEKIHHSQSSYSHFQSASVDWNMEQQWGKPNAFALKMVNEKDEIVGGIFVTHTVSGIRHWTLRHVVICEEHRNKGLATKLMAYLYNLIYTHQSNIKWLRFFSNKTSVDFYNKQGFEWLGLSKTGLPFTFVLVLDTDVKKSNALFKLVRDEEYNLIRHKMEIQFAKLKEVWYEFKPLSNDLSNFF